MNFFKNLTGLNKKTNIDVSDDSEEQKAQESQPSFATPFSAKVADAGVKKAAEGEPEEQWLAEDYDEGQLAIDVYQTKDAIIVKSTIAGVKPEDIDISVNNDMLTIRGKREMKEEISEENYFYQECYWGGFSRSIILPVEVKTDKIEATIENGVLTVTLPKAQTTKQISVKIKE